jgi:hypothetical protein
VSGLGDAIRYVKKNYPDRLVDDSLAEWAEQADALERSEAHYRESLNIANRELAAADHRYEWLTNLHTNALKSGNDARDQVDRVRELAENYCVRAKYSPTPLAQWADIEADLRRILDGAR